MECVVQASISTLNSAWGDGKHLLSLLASWDQTGIFENAAPADVQSILKIINTWLSSPDKRSDGLMLLHKIVAQSSDSILNENILIWIQQTTKYVEKHNDDKSRWISLMILRNLVQKARKFPNLTKMISTSVIPSVVECLNDPDYDIRFQGLACLAMCMEKYGGSCGSQKAAIERRLVDVAARGEGLETVIAAKCVAWLPMVGGGGTGQQEYKTTWKLLQQRLVGSIHAELDELFEGIVELPLSGVGEERQILPLPQLSETRAVPRLQQLEHRIANLCRYLKYLLQEPMDLVKSVLVEEVLSVVCRGLAVTGLSLGHSPTLEHQALFILLPSVHCSLLSVLNSLITIMRKDILPHHHTIFRLVINTLKWTKDEKITSGTLRRFGMLRAAAYESLVSWLEEGQACSGVHHFMDDLLPLILPDITPKKVNIILKISNQSSKYKKNKSRNQAAASMSSSAKPLDNSFSTSDSALCEAALKALIATLASAGPLIKMEHHKALHQFVVAQAMELFRGGDLPSLYARPACQVALLELLEAIVLQPHFMTPSPISYAITVFSAGQHSKFHEVANFCKRSLRVMERIIHPMVPSLIFSLDAEEDKTNEVRMQQINVAGGSMNMYDSIRSREHHDTAVAADTSGMQASDEDSAHSDSTRIISPARLAMTRKDFIKAYQCQPIEISKRETIIKSNGNASETAPELIDIATEPELIDLDTDTNGKPVEQEEDEESVADEADPTTNGNDAEEANELEPAAPATSKRTADDIKESDEDLGTANSPSSKKLKIPDSQIDDFTLMLGDFVE